MSKQISSGKVRFFLSTSLLALLTMSVAGEASAQDAAPEEVTVSATRVDREGYEAPTPTTVVGADMIDARAPANLANLVNELPALAASTTPTTNNALPGANAGMNLFNLRALGPNRTLVLLDGARAAPSNPSLNIDINTLPTELISRIDVVTGGASADWGSDAVAGVVNFVLNKKFEGFKGFAQGGATDQGDGENTQFGLTYGTSLFSDRAHFEVSGKYMYQNPVNGPALSNRSWYQGNKALANPNGSATTVILPNVGLSSGTDGGVITTTALRGTQFIGPAGTPAPFNFGFVSSLESVNGSAEDDGGRMQILNGQHEGNIFARGSYDLTDNISAYAEVSFAKSSVMAQSLAYNRFGNLTINSDNAFLPASTKAQMTAAGITSFTMGKVNQNLGFAYNDNDAEVLNFKVGLEGTIWDDWSWNAYYQHGRNGEYSRELNTANVANYNNATDAVLNPAGQVVCRSTLSAPGNGCLPLDVFGTPAISQSVKNYVAGTAYERIAVDQDNAAVNLRGTPFSTWAGPVSLATGFEYRREQYSVSTDPLSQSYGWFLSYGTPASGSYSVAEGFVETVVPLLSGQVFAKELDFNGAIRAAGYSRSGVATSWKLGVTDVVNDDVTLRGTWSTDIRAPNLQDLFATGSVTTNGLTDPVLKTGYQIPQTTSGNAALTPEVSHSISGGAVFHPTFLPNLTFSADYFSISIHDAIVAPAPQSIINQCASGNNQACTLVIRGASGTITNVFVSPLNIASESTSGIDYSVTYHTDLADIGDNWAGMLTARAMVTDTMDHTTNQLGTITQYAGTNGDGAFADPRWRGQFGLTYDLNRFSVTADAQYIGGGVISRKAPAIVNNSVPDIVYLNLSGSYNITDDLQVYAAIDNIMDTDPPVSPQVTTTPHINLGVDDYIYDTLGRRGRLGVRFNF